MGNFIGIGIDTMTSPADIIKYAIDARLSNVNTCIPARVLSYDYSQCKAALQPVLNKITISGNTIALPVLNNVPVIFPRTNEFSLTYPLHEGDYCLVLFSQRSIDLWLSVGGVITPDDNRMFDMSDAIAIPGIYPFAIGSPAHNNEDFLISYKGSEIKIKNDGAVEIKTSSTLALGNQTTELLQIISTLMTYLQGPTVTGTALGGPLNLIFTDQVLSLQNQLDSIKGTIS